ncbi:Lysosomal protective protein [Aphelenchoides bicaudatus]|nr:Lysosomal protective protein [Aphelenchoides bicaudatus]
MHEDLNFNTQVLWAYYHGQVGEDEWTELKKCCKRPTDNADPDECDWTHIPKSRENFNYVFDLSPCGKILNNIMNTDDSIDPYNFYQDCYETDVSKFRSQLQLSDEARKNPGSYFNRQSTDPSQGYACYNEQTALAYFNRSDFATAFHIDKAFYDAGGVFYDCNDELGKVYKTQHSDMTSQFNNILNSLKNFKVLILNGDVDTVCNFLGDARFIKRLAISRNMQPAGRGPWFYRKHVSGFTQRYIDSSNATVDVLTVKGSGHMVPMDRPGPALQMFSRFLDGTDYGKVDDKDIGVPDTLPYVKNPDSGANDGKLSVLMFVNFCIYWIQFLNI